MIIPRHLQSTSYHQNTLPATSISWQAAEVEKQNNSWEGVTVMLNLEFSPWFLSWAQTKRREKREQKTYRLIKTQYKHQEQNPGPSEVIGKRGQDILLKIYIYIYMRWKNTHKLLKVKGKCLNYIKIYFNMKCVKYCTFYSLVSSSNIWNYQNSS